MSTNYKETQKVWVDASSSPVLVWFCESYSFQAYKFSWKNSNDFLVNVVYAHLDFVCCELIEDIGKACWLGHLNCNCLIFNVPIWFWWKLLMVKLTHLRPILPFHTSWNQQEKPGFLVFLRGYKMVTLTRNELKWSSFILISAYNLCL